MRRRFVGSNNWDSNTLSRLWWAAELTHDESRGYELTKKAFTSQHVVRSLFGRLYSNHQDTATTFVEVFYDDPQEVVEKAAKRFNQRLSTVRIEAIAVIESRNSSAKSGMKLRRRLADSNSRTTIAC